MTEINEGVVVILSDDPDHDPDTCCFCQAQDGERTNAFTADQDSDDQPFIDGLQSVPFKNDAHMLGTNLKQAGSAPGDFTVPALDVGVTKASAPRDLQVGLAAHHLIPGNAAFAKSTLFKQKKKYLGSDGTAAGNIGYDINKAANGIWAPGNYAMRPWGSGGKQFSGDPAKYASAAIIVTQVQFHDAHPAYSAHVHAALDRIASKVDHLAQLCPQAAKRDTAASALVTLVIRLDGLSARCRRAVENPSAHWKFELRLSRFSGDFVRHQHL